MARGRVATGAVVPTAVEVDVIRVGNDGSRLGMQLRCAEVFLRQLDGLVDGDLMALRDPEPQDGELRV